NTSGTTSSLQGTKLYFSGGNSLTVSGNSNTLVFSVGNYLTTAALSADSSKYAGTGFTSAGANIGLSGTQNTAGLSLSATVAAQSNQSAIKAFGVSNTGQTAGNTGVSTGIDWVLAGSQSITLSQSTAGGGPNTVWLQHPAWLTTAALSADSSKYAGTGFSSAGNNIGLSGTQNTAGLSLSATVAAQTNQSLGIYASSNTTSSVSSGTVDARSLTLVGRGDLSVGYSNGSIILSDLTSSTTSYNTAGSATTVYPVASANSTGTVTRWALEDHRHAGVGGIGISTSGNTAGTTGSEVGTYWIQGGNSITVSQITSNNGSHTLVISAGNYLTTAALSGDTSKYAEEWALAGANTAGTTSSAQGTRWYFSGGNNFTISGNSNTIVFSGGSVAAAPVNFSAGTTSGNLGSVVFSNSNGLSF